jgi:hypothetical protein
MAEQPDELFFQAGWQSYEEYGHVTIYMRPDQSFYYIREGSSVFATPQCWVDGPTNLNEEQAFDLMVEWDRYEREYDEYWDSVGGPYGP